MHDAPLLIEGSDWLEPGGEADIRLHPLFQELWPLLSPGDRFELREGRRILGHAEFIERVPPTTDA
jgi:hypothetical protein